MKVKIYNFQTTPISSMLYRKEKVQQEIDIYIEENNIYRPSIKKIEEAVIEAPQGKIYCLNFYARGITEEDIFREQMEYFIENL